MTQAQDIPTWGQTFQLKLMAALDAAWKTIEAATDPAVIRAARDRARAIGDLAAMARKVALIVPTPRGKPKSAETAAAGLHAAQGVADVSAMIMASKAAAAPVTAPVAAQAEHTRRALDKLKGGRRGRL
ncbi:hypothetical protein [Caulobacter sp.]|uniref:hypothetical protein n=1 Tax=Caulobacter sp. TaxID=78 RepID=UPI003BB10378